MKDKINELLPKHQLKTSNSKILYITDYKDLRHVFNRTDVDLSDSKPAGIESVVINNENEVEICFDGFSENALPLENLGYYNRQCECVLFPDSCEGNYWVLFVEAKYANDINEAFKSEHNYPHNMVDQVIQTVQYFRDKSIIENNKRVNAIVSFPNLIEAFNSTLFRGNLSINDILINHKIKIRATNSAEIISEKRIKI